MGWQDSRFPSDKESWGSGSDDDAWSDSRIKSISVSEKAGLSYPWFRPIDANGRKLRRGQSVSVKIGQNKVSGKLLGSYPNGDCWVRVGRSDVRIVPKDMIWVGKLNDMEEFNRKRNNSCCNQYRRTEPE